MKVYRFDEADKIKLKDTAVALGEFDAVHIGHIDIVKKAVSAASDNGLLSVVLMFENNPADYIFKTETQPINTLEKRLEIIEKLGVDVVVALRFDDDIMNMPHDEFFREYLVERLDAKFLSVGFNYNFGHGGKGDAEYLKEACKSNGILLNVTPEIKALGSTVSSTRIRSLISNGEVDMAGMLLDRFFSIEGKVIRGNQLGKSLFGFPTANISLPKNSIVPRFGVYISRVKLDGKIHNSITNVGKKPTVSGDVSGIEAHIIGEDLGPLYDKIIEVEFCKYIRDIIAFDDADGLKKQLEADKMQAIKYFKE